jgi:hypothetical protein
LRLNSSPGKRRATKIHQFNSILQFRIRALLRRVGLRVKSVSLTATQNCRNCESLFAWHAFISCVCSGIGGAPSWVTVLLAVIVVTLVESLCFGGYILHKSNHRWGKRARSSRPDSDSDSKVVAVRLEEKQSFVDPTEESSV